MFPVSLNSPVMEKSKLPIAESDQLALPSMSKSVMSSFLQLPSFSTSLSENLTARADQEEPTANDMRRTSVRFGVLVDSMRRCSSNIVLSRSRSDCHLVSSSSSTSMSSIKSKKRSRSLANHLGGFVLYSVTPRESSILQYTSIVSLGTHTEYELVLEDTLSWGVGERWFVSRRYSGFRSLRNELARVFDRSHHCETAVDRKHAHCLHCAPMVEALDKLNARYFPKRRLWGSKSHKVVQHRAKQFFKYLQGLLALATSPSTRRCPLVALGFAVQLRIFLTLEREPYRGTPFGGGIVPFLLSEMSLRPDKATTLVTIDELDAAYADSDDEVYDLERHHLNNNSYTSSMVSDLPSPIYMLQEQDELRSWDELENCDWQAEINQFTVTAPT